MIPHVTGGQWMAQPETVREVFTLRFWWVVDLVRRFEWPAWTVGRRA